MTKRRASRVYFDTHLVQISQEMPIGCFVDAIVWRTYKMTSCTNANEAHRQRPALIQSHPHSTGLLRRILAPKLRSGGWTSESVPELQQKRQGRTSPQRPRLARPMLVSLRTQPLVMLPHAQVSSPWHRTFAPWVVLFHKGSKELALDLAQVLEPLVHKGFLA